jgi:hypothetical protein
MLQKKRRPWTDDEDRRLLDMLEHERSKTSIAVALRRSVAAVKGRLRVLRTQQKESGSPERADGLAG